MKPVAQCPQDTDLQSWYFDQNPERNIPTVSVLYVLLLRWPNVSLGESGYLELHFYDSEQTYMDEINKNKVLEKLKKNKREKMKLS